MSKIDQQQGWSVSVDLGAAEATKIIKANTDVDKKLYITRIIATVLVSAAQSVTIENDGGSHVFISIPASPVVGTQFFFENTYGYECAKGTSLEAIASAAGLGLLIVAEGYTKVLK